MTTIPAQLELASEMEKLIKQVAQLSEAEQEKIAKLWLKELEMEVEWQKSFNQSTDLLEQMADNAWKEVDQGKAKRIDWDEV